MTYFKHFYVFIFGISLFFNAISAPQKSIDYYGKNGKKNTAIYLGSDGKLSLRGFTQLSEAFSIGNPKRLDLRLFDLLRAIEESAKLNGIELIVRPYPSAVTDISSGGHVSQEVLERLKYYDSGEAIAFEIKGVDIVALGKWLRSYQDLVGYGGIGFHQKGDVFWVHFDTGPSLVWVGDNL